MENQDMYLNDRSFFLDKNPYQENDSKVNNFLYEDQEYSSKSYGFNDNVNTIVNSMGVKNILKKSKKKKIKKKEKSYFNEFVAMFIIFYILNSQSMIYWIKNNNIQYTSSLILRCFAFIIIYYILKFFIFI
jgi:hypothetical protein